MVMAWQSQIDHHSAKSLSSFLPPSHRRVRLGALRLGFWLETRAPWKGDWSLVFFGVQLLIDIKHCHHEHWVWLQSTAMSIYDSFTIDSKAFWYSSFIFGKIIGHFQTKFIQNLGGGKSDRLPNREYERSGQLPQGFHIFTFMSSFPSSQFSILTFF